MGALTTKLYTNGIPEGIPGRFIYMENGSLPSPTDDSADPYDTIQLDAESVSDQEVCTGPDESLCQQDQDEDDSYTVLSKILSSDSGPKERSPCHVCPVHFVPLNTGLCDSNCTDNHRDKIIEFMVEVFKPLIMKRIDASEVVQYLDFIENPHIRGLVNSQTEKDNAFQERLLEWHAPDLARNIYIADILDKLEEEEVISVTDKEKVMAMNRQRGETHAAFLLLDLVPNRLEDWGSRFIKVLRKCGMPDYASNLEEVMPLKTSHENALQEKQANDTEVKRAPTPHLGNSYTPMPEGGLKATTKLRDTSHPFLESATEEKQVQTKDISKNTLIPRWGLKATIKPSGAQEVAITPPELPPRRHAKPDIYRPSVESRDSTKITRRSQEMPKFPPRRPDTTHLVLKRATEDKHVQTTGISKKTLIPRWGLTATTKPSGVQEVAITPPELPPRRYAKPDIYRPCVESRDSTKITRRSHEMPKFPPRCPDTTHLVLKKGIYFAY